MTSGRPRLSLVLASRNADEESLLALKGTLNAWDRFARTRSDCLEIIVVELPPPSSRPSLRQSLRKMDLGLTVRLFSFPEKLDHLHGRSLALPHLEHLAWNVGIRRSNADYILVTRPGVLPTPELADFVLRGRLVPGKLYRADVYEMSGEAVDAPFLAAKANRIHLARETLDLAQRKTIMRFQESFAVWGEPISTGLMFLLTHILLFCSLLFHSLLAAKTSNLRYLPHFGKVLARDFSQAAYLYRVRRAAWLFFRSLHLNAAGDFLLADREHWMGWRGVPEYQGHSFLVDAMFVLAAVGSGSAREKRLVWPMAVLRTAPLDIEGPAADEELPVLTPLAAARQADGWRLSGPSFSFNLQDWGLGELELLENVLGGKASLA